MLDRTATTWLKRLLIWLEWFEQDFSRQSQRGALRRYVSGLLSDSRRKSMEAMWARLSDPGTYQAFQHFITHAPWDAETTLETAARARPRAHGDADSRRDEFPQTGTGLRGGCPTDLRGARQDRQLPDGRHRGVVDGDTGLALGATLYLPEEWLTRRQRTRAQIPAAVRFAPKWQLALTLLRQVRAAGFTVTAVAGDAEFGDNATLRRMLHRAKLPYALGVSSDLKVFLGTPALEAPPPLTGKGRPRTRRRLPPDTSTVEARAWAVTQTPRQWRLVSWRNGTNRPWRARFCAVRVTPAHDWRDARRLAPEVWLLCERELAGGDRVRYYLVDLPATASLRALVRLAHQRWAIEQQYQELKDEIGLDHFEGRSLPGWQRHVVLTAIAYSFLQTERRRRGQTHLTLPRVRAVIQEVLTAHFFMTQPHYLKWMLKLKDVEMRM